MRMETNFGATRAYTVGVEEEFQLVDPASHKLVPAIEAVLAAREAAGLPADSVASELSASCVEMRSPIFDTVAELATELPTLRRRVRDLAEGCGARLAAAGSHPFSESTAQPITASERYRRVEEEMGWAARMQAIYGLHVHVAVPDEEHAIRAVNALSRHVPLFVALSANSPFWRGADTRLSSTRAKIFGLVPRSGLPPRFRSWGEFEGYVDTLVGAASMPDYTWCWWDARPHPRLGTVELRALDAHLHDFSTGESVSARDAARDLVKALRSVSQDFRCETELEGVLGIVEAGTGAEKQRAVFGERNSLEDVVKYLIAATA